MNIDIEKQKRHLDVRKCSVANAIRFALFSILPFLLITNASAATDVSIDSYYVNFYNGKLLSVSGTLLGNPEAMVQATLSAPRVIDYARKETVFDGVSTKITCNGLKEWKCVFDADINMKYIDRYSIIIKVFEPFTGTYLATKGIMLDAYHAPTADHTAVNMTVKFNSAVVSGRAYDQDQDLEKVEIVAPGAVGERTSCQITQNADNPIIFDWVCEYKHQSNDSFDVVVFITDKHGNEIRFTKKIGSLIDSLNKSQLVNTFVNDSWTYKALQSQQNLDYYAPLSQASFLSTHNSYGSTSYSDSIDLISNQDYSMADQMTMGIRNIELDVWLTDEPGPGGSDFYICHSEKALGDCYLHDLVPGIDPRRFITGLNEIGNWLASHPDEVVVLFLDLNTDDQTYLDLATNDIKKSKISQHVYRPVRPHYEYGNPRKGKTHCVGVPMNISKADVLAAGKQVIIINKNCNTYGYSDGYEGYHSWVYAGSGNTDMYSDAQNGFIQGKGELHFTSYPECGVDKKDTESKRDTYDNYWIRFVEDRTISSAVTDYLSSLEEGEDGNNDSTTTSPDMAEEMQKCGVNFISLDSITPTDIRFKRAIWSWDETQPDNAEGNEHCAEHQTNGRFNDTLCGERDDTGKVVNGKEKRFACRLRSDKYNTYDVDLEGFDEEKVQKVQYDIEAVKFEDILNAADTLIKNAGAVTEADKLKAESIAKIINGDANEFNGARGMWGNETGVWYITDAKGTWGEGEDACKYETGGLYHFAAPVNGYDNEKLKEKKEKLIEAQELGINENVWINFSDNISGYEGKWMPGEIPGAKLGKTDDGRTKTQLIPHKDLDVVHGSPSAITIRGKHPIGYNGKERVVALKYKNRKKMKGQINAFSFCESDDDGWKCDAKAPRAGNYGIEIRAYDGEGNYYHYADVPHNIPKIKVAPWSSVEHSTSNANDNNYGGIRVWGKSFIDEAEKQIVEATIRVKYRNNIMERDEYGLNDCDINNDTGMWDCYVGGLPARIERYEGIVYDNFIATIEYSNGVEYAVVEFPFFIRECITATNSEHVDAFRAGSYENGYFSVDEIAGGVFLGQKPTHQTSLEDHSFKATANDTDYRPNEVVYSWKYKPNGCQFRKPVRPIKPEIKINNYQAADQLSVDGITEDDDNNLQSISATLYIHSTYSNVGLNCEGLYEWSCSIDERLQSGKYSLVVKALDANGNLDSKNVDFTVDDFSDIQIIQDDPKQSVSGEKSAEEGFDDIQIIQNGSKLSLSGEKFAEVDSITVDFNGNAYICDSASLSDCEMDLSSIKEPGEYSVEVTVQSGNYMQTYIVSVEIEVVYASVNVEGMQIALPTTL